MLKGIIKSLKNIVQQLEKIDSNKNLDSELYDERGVLWKNRAAEYKRKNEKLCDKYGIKPREDEKK